MSRLIVKNLPNGMKEERLRSLFERKGQITDCKMKFTKDGRFRKFAFIGYNTEKEAAAAIKFFNNSFINTSKIQVEIANDLSDKNKPRAWSKYSKDSSAYQREHNMQKPKPSQEEVKEKKLKKKKSEREKEVDKMLGELKNDKGFAAFLEAHERKGKAGLWDNDAADLDITKASQISDTRKKGSKELVFDGDIDSDDEDYHSDNKKTADDSDMETDDDKGRQSKPADSVSDLDYLKSKMTDQNLLNDSDSSDDDDDDDVDDDDEEESSSKKEEDKDSSASSSGEQDEDEDDKTKNTKKPQFVIKMKGLHGFSGERSVKDFFKPLRTCAVKIPRNAKRKAIGVAYISFGSEKDMDQAMRKNKNFIGGRRVFLKKCGQEETPLLAEEQAPRPWELKTDDGNAEDEDLAESGRLFVRNLAYTCTEEDLQTLFGEYGNIAEIHLPVDSLTKKVKGFAFVTFMIPENAVKAYSALDGKTFMGRLLHLIPSKMKKDELTEESAGSSYKTQKQAKQKAQASSSHNWNSLFLGANAVADVLADKYSTSKSQILDAETHQSLGVRMALGETQIVAETRDFLVDNGVALDSFSQPSAARSKTVILVKNLPAGTKTEELRDLFSKYGNLGRVLLPPSGITAIIEYLEPSEAKAGFRNLAYSKFQHVPLYLEWAPVEVFKPQVTETNKQSKKKNKKGHTGVIQTLFHWLLKPYGVQATGKRSDHQQKKKEEEEEEEEVSSSSSDEEGQESQSTVFVKNLSFSTTKAALQKKFSQCGTVRNVSIATKNDIKNPGKVLSMGFGFVEYKHKSGAEEAMQELQHTVLDGHTLELKLSNRTSVKQVSKKTKKKQKDKKQTTTKILVRNIPFEAKRNEIYELFKVFGELKTVRLPKKMSGTGSHRGFGFVDFLTKHDAKRAFEALCHSTHLYGRRLVLEWAETADDIDELRKKTAERFHDEVPNKRVKKSALMESLESAL